MYKAGNCTCKVHDPQQLAARAVTINQRSAECSSGTTAHNDKQVGIFSRDSSNLIPWRRQGVAMVVGCTDGQKNGLAAQTLTGGQQNGLHEGGGGQVEEGNDEGYGGAAALHAANFGLQEDGGYASGDFCVGVPDGPTTPPRAVVAAMAMAIVAAAAAMMANAMANSVAGVLAKAACGA